MLSRLWELWNAVDISDGCGAQRTQTHSEQTNSRWSSSAFCGPGYLGGSESPYLIHTSTRKRRMDSRVRLGGIPFALPVLLHISFSLFKLGIWESTSKRPPCVSPLLWSLPLWQATVAEYPHTHTHLLIFPFSLVSINYQHPTLTLLGDGFTEYATIHLTHRYSSKAPCCVVKRKRSEQRLHLGPCGWKNDADPSSGKLFLVNCVKS